MRVKRYDAGTVLEALSAVRRDLGPDAVILHTRRLPRSGLARLLGRERFEVIAAIDVDSPDPEMSRRTTVPGLRDKQTARPELKEPVFQPYSRGDGESETLEEVWGESTGGTQRARGPYESAPGTQFIKIHEHLLESDVDPDLAETVIRAARMKWREAQLIGRSAYEVVLDLMAQTIPATNGIELAHGTRKVIALVGATGVGKTTTLAKIGALFSLFGKKKVAFVTADTYRIAAMDQLRTYAEIIGVPLDVAYTPAEMRESVAMRQDCDLVLIDTAGRSPRSNMSIAELRAFLEAARADETHLVLSMNTRPRDLFDIVAKFSPCGTNRLIFSKLDETTRLGAIPSVVSSFELPVSYVTFGQNVPQDIKAADAALLARWVLDGGIGDVVEGPSGIPV